MHTFAFKPTITMTFMQKSSIAQTIPAAILNLIKGTTTTLLQINKWIDGFRKRSIVNILITWHINI